jgi:hypothetical protein
MSPAWITYRPLLLEAIKEQQKQIEALKAEIEVLKKAKM